MAYRNSRNIDYTVRQENAENIFVPLVSPTQDVINFWIEPFDAGCRNDLE